MKTESNKVQIRKRALEYCILLQLANKPLYVGDILEMVKKSKMIVKKEAHSSQLQSIRSYDYKVDQLEDSLYQSPGNKIHLLWLWTGFIHIAE